ncbi:hypothetical protein C8R43DRAFT_963449 [Mycena crocata]|nr:hypothetical protein C8R43DRAFT_963449 [Mycena crocata]
METAGASGDVATCVAVKVSTTTVMKGLPPLTSPSATREHILAMHRTRFAEETGEYAHISYDIACQFYERACSRNGGWLAHGLRRLGHGRVRRRCQLAQSGACGPSRSPSPSVPGPQPSQAPPSPSTEPTPTAFVPASQVMEGSSILDESMEFFVGDDAQRRERWSEAIAGGLSSSRPPTAASTSSTACHQLCIISLEVVTNITGFVSSLRRWTLPLRTYTLEFLRRLSGILLAWAGGSAWPGVWDEMGGKEVKVPSRLAVLLVGAAHLAAAALSAQVRRMHHLRDVEWRAVLAELPMNSTSYTPPSGRPSYRAPNRSQALDGGFVYETRPGDLTRDTSFHVSIDGLRGIAKAVNVGVKRLRITPADLDDTLRSWDPMWEAGKAAPDPAGTGDAGDKRKFYESSDATMEGWRPLAGRFMDELIQHEGLGDSIHLSSCSTCKEPYDKKRRRLCCEDCGRFVECDECVVKRHTTSPLHRLKEWNGTYWIWTTLHALGSEYQLGHGGLACRRPVAMTHDMVVMDVKYIHTVRIRYCGCDVSAGALNLEQLMRTGWYPATITDPGTCTIFAALDLFRLLSVVANVNVKDFVTTLEKNTNATATESVPDRYRAFGCMVRQWAFLNRLMRAGVAQNAGGIADVKARDTAQDCWTCPHDGKNIPVDWREVAPEFRFLYMLILAMDANFRMKSRLRKNARMDNPLGPGLGYLVEGEPYADFLKDYIGEKDVSTCIAFTALLQKDTQVTTGLRCSGVGGVVCAQHEVVRPHGIGDLQKGERYANMDFILFASIVGKINLPTRMAKLPEKMKVDLNRVNISFGLPVWHAAAHERKCQVQNSLTYMEGVARTDGEGIERLWSRIIRLAWASKEMGRGAREDAIEDLIDYLNQERNIGQGTALPLKLVVAINERDRQVAGFTEVDAGLKDKTRRKWQKKIDEWLADRSKPNPYEVEGGRENRGSSLTSFVAAGLGLEEDQRQIRRELKGRTLLSNSLEEKVEEMRISFFSKLSAFRKLQEVYMPPAVAALDGELPPPQAKDVKLYLPSELWSAHP